MAQQLPTREQLFSTLSLMMAERGWRPCWRERRLQACHFSTRWDVKCEVWTVDVPLSKEESLEEQREHQHTQQQNQYQLQTTVVSVMECDDDKGGALTTMDVGTTDVDEDNNADVVPMDQNDASATTARHGCTVVVTALNYVDVAFLRKCCYLADKTYNSRQLVVVYSSPRDNVTAAAKQMVRHRSVASSQGPALHVSLFHSLRLTRPYVHHELVPAHDRISEAQALAIMEPCCRPEQLGTLAANDPVAEWYGWNIGDWILVTRPAFGTLGASRRLEQVRWEDPDLM